MARIGVIAWIFILAGWSAQGAELRLRAEATISRGMVRLADVAQITGNDSAVLQGVLLFPAPGAGKERIVRRGEIAELLALNEINVHEHSLTGADQVVIRRASAAAAPTRSGVAPSMPATAEQSVQHALVSYLESHQPGDIDWSVVPAIPSRYLGPLKDAQRITVAGGQAPFTGRQSFELVARIGGHDRRIPIEADVAVLRRATVAVRAVPRGQVLRSDDVQTQPLAADSAGEEKLPARDEIIGREAIKELRPGQVITSDAVQLPRLVHRGDKITVRSLAAGVTISTSGKATQDGALGDWIAVDLDEPKRQILSRVTGPQVVEIGSSQPPSPAAAEHLQSTSIQAIGAAR